MKCARFAKAHELSKQEQEQVAEIAKKTIAFMSQNKISFTPRNYDEWFYVICKAIDEDHLLTPKNLKVLYEKYFHEIPIFDGEEIKEISYSLKHLTEDSHEALDRFEHNINSHKDYIEESIDAINEQDTQKMEELKLKIADLEAENRKLRDFLDQNKRRLEFIEEKFQEQKREVELDPLTGLYNRRSLEQDAEKLEHSGMRYSLLIADIDNFKSINDTYGHLVGDKVLQEVGEILTNYVRSNTKTYRYGGEEFVILLPQGDKRAARVVGERLREVIANRTLQLDNGVLNFTASFGGAQKEENESFKDVLKRADEALYEAKKSGKNRVIIR